MILGVECHKLLQGYAADGPPWADGEGRPALVRLLESRARRLARFREYVARDGIDLDAGFAAASLEPLIRELDEWTFSRWPALADCARADPMRWRAARWQPADAPLYTLILDLGVALGEVAIRHRPTLAWATNDDPDLAADGDERYGRIMLVGPYRPDGSGPRVSYDVFAESFMRFQAIAHHMTIEPRQSFLADLVPVLDAGKPR